MTEMTMGQYDLTFNAFSFTFATFAAATLFFWISRGQVAQQYRTALTITGLVTFIAAYHYYRIGESWTDAYQVVDGAIVATGVPFNDAYRYVDWLLTVPLLLIELILVMGLSRQETIDRSVRLGGLAALMIALGYPGEIADSLADRWFWGIASMVPFTMIVLELFKGLSQSIDNQPDEVKPFVELARWVLVGSWAFYPVVFFAGAIGIDGAIANTIIQVGYTVADVVAKAVFGVLIYMIALRKSEASLGGGATKSAVPAE